MSHFFKEFIENKKWKQIKKSDWIVLALVGVLLLVISLPDGRGKTRQDDGQGEELLQTADGENGREEDYAAYLEEKLERVLTKIDGVGKVTVMVTVSDAGEHVVEKDENFTRSETVESDSSGGSRNSRDVKNEKTTVYVEKGSETYPYVQREKLPTVEGVVVVAEGGANARVVSDISGAVQALLSVEMHRIKVVKMESREE